MLPKALKSCPKSNKSPNLVTLIADFMPDRRVDRCGVGWSDASLTVDGLELTYLSSTDNNLHARTGVNKEGWGFEAGRWIHFPLVLDVVAISLKKTFFAQFSSVQFFSHFQLKLFAYLRLAFLKIVTTSILGKCFDPKSCLSLKCV